MKRIHDDEKAKEISLALFYPKNQRKRCGTMQYRLCTCTEGQVCYETYCNSIVHFSWPVQRWYGRNGSRRLSTVYRSCLLL